MKDTRDRFCPFRKEFQMEVIETHLADDLRGRKDVKILEACCGQGRLLHYLSEFAPQQQFYGFDYTEEFVDEANELFKDNDKVHCFVADIFALPASMQKDYDITFLYKTLGYIPNYPEVLKALFNVTKEKIYITAALYEGDIDFDIKIRPYKQLKGADDYVMNYIYSQPRLVRYIEALGAKAVKLHDMKFPGDLPKPKDPDVLQTYTIRAASGENIELANIIKLDWKLIEVQL